VTRAVRRSALHNAAEAGDTELLAKLLTVKGDDDFDPVRARCRLEAQRSCHGSAASALGPPQRCR
jgi:hypothetical protein